MVPRSFTYSSPPQSRPLYQDERDARETTATRRPPKEEAGKEILFTSTKPARMTLVSPATPSKPMIIPTRSQTGGLRKGRDHTLVAMKKTERHDRLHYPQSIPPATAALLAITSLQRPAKRRPHPQEGQGQRIHRSGLQTIEGIDPEEVGHEMSSSNSRSWGVLLSPPLDLDTEKYSFSSDTDPGHMSSVRSISSESMPSLDIDLGLAESLSDPPTPYNSSRTRSSAERRQKALSSSLIENCALDHPLLVKDLNDGLGPPAIASDVKTLNPDVDAFEQSLRSSFKSNLTASFRALRSAARSFSTFTPFVQPDDFLSQSFFSRPQQFTDEVRPMPSDKPPDLALRRYLNPVIASPAELHNYHDHERRHSSQEQCTASIQLQTYHRAVGPTREASSPPVFILHPLSEAVDELSGDTVSRQREPRENSDFLRVIVLEMNMRKVGKLSDAAPGRARLWLPARQISSHSLEETGIPRRWVGITVV